MKKFFVLNWKWCYVARQGFLHKKNFSFQKFLYRILLEFKNRKFNSFVPSFRVFQTSFRFLYFFPALIDYLEKFSKLKFVFLTCSFLFKRVVILILVPYIFFCYPLFIWGHLEDFLLCFSFWFCFLCLGVVGHFVRRSIQVIWFGTKILNFPGQWNHTIFFKGFWKVWKWFWVEN